MYQFQNRVLMEQNYFVWRFYSDHRLLKLERSVSDDFVSENGYLTPSTQTERARPELSNETGFHTNSLMKVGNSHFISIDSVWYFRNLGKYLFSGSSSNGDRPGIINDQHFPGID
jgi:hypothetical protein